MVVVLVIGLLTLAGESSAGTCGNVTNGIIGTGSFSELQQTALAGCCDACLTDTVRSRLFRSHCTTRPFLAATGANASPDMRIGGFAVHVSRTGATSTPYPYICRTGDTGATTCRYRTLGFCRALHSAYV